MKVEIVFKSIGNAGMYNLVIRENGISETMRIILSGGQPYYSARSEAERLAVALNCDLFENGELIRKAINKGEK